MRYWKYWVQWDFPNEGPQFQGTIEAETEKEATKEYHKRIDPGYPNAQMADGRFYEVPYENRDDYPTL